MAHKKGKISKINFATSKIVNLKEYWVPPLVIYKIEMIADKNQNNTYAFTNFRVTIYQVIYATMIIVDIDFFSEKNQPSICYRRTYTTDQ